MEAHFADANMLNSILSSRSKRAWIKHVAGEFKTKVAISYS